MSKIMRKTAIRRWNGTRRKGEFTGLDYMSVPC